MKRSLGWFATCARSVVLIFKWRQGCKEFWFLSRPHRFTTSKTAIDNRCGHCCCNGSASGIDWRYLQNDDVSSFISVVFARPPINPLGSGMIEQVKDNNLTLPRYLTSKAIEAFIHCNGSNVLCGAPGQASYCVLKA